MVAHEAYRNKENLVVLEYVTYVVQVLTFIFDEVVSHDDRQAM